MLLYAAMMDGEEAAALKLARIMPSYPTVFGPKHMSDGKSLLHGRGCLPSGL
jgi:hypothetical protein